MICNACNKEVDNVNDMNVCENCDELIKKRVLIKKSTLSNTSKEKLLKEINNCSIKDIQEIITTLNFQNNKITLDNLINEMKNEQFSSHLTPIVKDVFSIFHTTTSYKKYLWIDDDNQLWCPNPYVDWFDNTIIKEKNHIYNFEDIDYYEIRENGETIKSSTKGGLGSAILGGAFFGGVGAIVGSNVGKKKTIAQSNVNYIVFIFLKNTNIPTVSINCRNSIEDANTIVGFINQIVNKTNKEQNEIENNTQKNEVSIADEILKYKNLLDTGTITKEEFEKLKKKIIDS